MNSGNILIFHIVDLYAGENMWISSVRKQRQVNFSISWNWFLWLWNIDKRRNCILFCSSLLILSKRAILSSSYITTVECFPKRFQQLRFADMEKRAVNDMFVVISDIWLDNKDVIILVYLFSLYLVCAFVSFLVSADLNIVLSLD